MNPKQLQSDLKTLADYRKEEAIFLFLSILTKKVDIYSDLEAVHEHVKNEIHWFERQYSEEDTQIRKEAKELVGFCDG